AKARAKESLNGAYTRSGSVLARGLKTMLIEHCIQHPFDQWHADNPQAFYKDQRIGTKPLQHFLDDMPRYEHMVGITSDIGEPKDGMIPLRVIAIRGTAGDRAGKVAAKPEVCFLKEKEGARKPVDVVLHIPEIMKDRIPNFLEEVGKS